MKQAVAFYSVAAVIFVFLIVFLPVTGEPGTCWICGGETEKIDSRIRYVAVQFFGDYHKDCLDCIRQSQQP
jgi:hypothetical protein